MAGESSTSGESLTDRRSADAADVPPARVAPLYHRFEDALAWARDRDYAGWDYCDGMSSRVRRALPFDNRWVNLAIQETVKRSPVNVRPLFGVEQRRNYQGAALFAMANLNAARLESTAVSGYDDVDYVEQARSLCDWLVEESCTGYAGFCGGHRHQIQHLSDRGVPNDPDVVSTSYAVRALLAAADLDPEYARTARTAERFLVEDMDYREVDDGARIDYHLNSPEGMFTVNAAALGARTMLDLYAVSGEERLRERAEAILDHVAGLQYPSGGWEYTDPPEKSRLGKDSHHNGFVLESLLRHREVVGDHRYAATVESGLEFYRDLFEEDGAPAFDDESAYPRDVHAAAQGILTFTYAREYERAERVLGWTLEHLKAPDEPRFYYRKGRLITKKFTLMRWCQAWTCYAISEYLVETRLPDVADTRMP